MELITTEQLMDYLGVDADSEGIIARERESAIEELKRATGIDWTQAEEKGVANSAIEIIVWLAYYANRSDVGNTDYLRHRLTSLILQLQYGEEVYPPDADNEQGNADEADSGG